MLRFACAIIVALACATCGGSPPAATSANEVANRDLDGDGIRDDIDRCPREPEDHNGRDDEDGCPDKPRECPGPFAIQDRLDFESSTTAFGATANRVLDAIAATLKGNPDVELVEVRGHARADEMPELALSRAQLVRDELIARGVGGARLRSIDVGNRCGAEARVDFRFAVIAGREQPQSEECERWPGELTAPPSCQ